MFYVLGLKLNRSSEASSPYIVEQQVLISTELGFDQHSKEQMELGFAVQSENTVITLLSKQQTIEDAVAYVKSEWKVFEMPLPNNGSPDTSAPTVMRFGVRKISKGLFATFDFSPPQFGGDPYNPIKLADGCEVLIVSDDKAHNLSEYMKAAIAGKGGDVDTPTLEDIKAGKDALKELGFQFEAHDSLAWGVAILVGKEPQIV